MTAGDRIAAVHPTAKRRHDVEENVSACPMYVDIESVNVEQILHKFQSDLSLSHHKSP